MELRFTETISNIFVITGIKQHLKQTLMFTCFLFIENRIYINWFQNVIMLQSYQFFLWKLFSVQSLGLSFLEVVWKFSKGSLFSACKSM